VGSNPTPSALYPRLAGPGVHLSRNGVSLMGVSINAHVYDQAALVDEINSFVNNHGGIREGALLPDEWLEKVGNEYGLLIDGKFIVVWNEYHEDYNPATTFLGDVVKYYFPETDEDDYDFWSSNYTTIDGGVEDVLGSVFEEEFGYEGKFIDDE
jgi:hypothetical protein